MLLLSSQSTLIHDQKPGDHFYGIGTEIIVDQRQNEVDSRRHACRSPDRAIVNEDPILLRLDVGKSDLKPAAWAQCIVARRPLRRPASARTNAPLQMEAVRLEAFAASRTNAIMVALEGGISISVI